MSKLPRFEGEAYGCRENGAPPVEIQVQATEPHGLRGGLFLSFSPSIPSTKQALREAILAARRQFAPEERALRSEQIAARVLSLEAFERSRTLAVYAPMGAEVDPSAIAAEALARGKRLAYPVLDGAARPLRFAVCTPGALVAGALRCLVPPPEAEPIAPATIDLVLVPGIAFDSAGRRLGRGRGHYDATLAALRPDALRLGLAFELQLVPEVPQEPHDALLDVVVTEARVLWRRAAPNSASR
jgi:5-formyltetrahydrofolate cyclo-ligase